MPTKQEIMPFIDIEDIPLEQLPIGKECLVKSLRTNKYQLSRLPQDSFERAITLITAYIEELLKVKPGLEMFIIKDYLPHIDEYNIAFFIKRVK